MISVEKLKEYSNNLEFSMSENEYKTLKNEFEILFKQMNLIDDINGISNYEPMDYPFSLSDVYLREDKVNMCVDRNEAFRNAKEVSNGCIKTPKVVE